MPLTVIGGASGASQNVEAGSLAARVTLFPVGAAGIYRVSHLSGTIAAGLGAASEILQFRWTSPTKLALIHRILLDGLAGSATAFASGFGKIDAVIARAWTADGSGGADLTMTTNNAKLRTSMATSAVGVIRGATTAALTAGTKTLDAQPFGLLSLAFGTVVSVQYALQVPLFDAMAGAQQPLALATEEGFVVRATVPGTGTWQVGITVEWAEKLATEWP